MTITYHTSRSAAREYAQNNGGKVVDNGANWSSRLLEPKTASRWAVYSNDENVIGVTVKVSKDREEKGTHSIPASEVYGMMDRMLPAKAKTALPANARILVSRNKREGKYIGKSSARSGSHHWHAGKENKYSYAGSINFANRMKELS